MNDCLTFLLLFRSFIREFAYFSHIFFSFSHVFLSQTPLHCAAACGHISVISSLLAYGADVNATDVRWCERVWFNEDVNECVDGTDVASGGTDVASVAA